MPLDLCLVRNIYLAKSRQNRIQKLVFILYNDEETRIMAEKLNTSAQGTLGVNGQFIGIHEDDAFEHIIVVTLHVGFCEVFELVADETDALAMSAIYKHDVGFNAIAVAAVDLIDEIAHDGAFAGSGRPVENQIRNLANRYEIIQLFDYICVF
jgi:hypothetical protein